jgi:hypothetical protein
MMVSMAGKKGSLHFYRTRAAWLSCRPAEIVNAALRPAVLRIETSGAGP